jgi:hypothetical protein
MFLYPLGTILLFLTAYRLPAVFVKTCVYSRAHPPVGYHTKHRARPHSRPRIGSPERTRIRPRPQPLLTQSYDMAGNLAHRTKSHSRPGLRLPKEKQPRVCKPQKSPSQRSKDRHAARVLSSWDFITRSNKDSRGIHRLPGNNECFRLSAVQALLHLPKFINWTLTHNEDGNFPCHRNIKTKTSEQKIFRGICPACAIKRLIRKYWGDQNLRADGTPVPLAGNDPDVRRIHRLDDNISGEVGAHEQQDAEECQARLLDACLNSVDHE